MQNTKAERAKNLRYKRPALASLGYDAIETELSEIQEACSDVHWFMDNDSDTLLNALDGDEDEVWEFKLAFSDLEYKAERLSEDITGWDVREDFDICTVALIGNRYRAVGYDAVEEDYFSLTSFEEGLAYTEAGKKLMRHTKQEMISKIGQSFGITLAFFDLRQSYDYLKVTFDILRDENTSLLQTLKSIQSAYDQAAKVEFQPWCEESKTLNALLNYLPERIWLE